MQLLVSSIAPNRNDSKKRKDSFHGVVEFHLRIGYIKVKATNMEDARGPSQMTSEQATAIIGNYNRMFSYLYRYMLREVGPITEHVLRKYLAELQEANAPVLQNVNLRKDGTLDPSALQHNTAKLSADQQKDVLVTALNEFLYAAILAVKRTLGPEHETRVIETLKDIRPEL